MRNRRKPRSAHHALGRDVPQRKAVTRGDYEAVHSDPAGGCRPSRYVERIPLVLDDLSGYEIDGSGTVWRANGSSGGGHRRIRALQLAVALEVWAGHTGDRHVERVCPGVRRLRLQPGPSTTPWDASKPFISTYRTHRIEQEAGSKRPHAALGEPDGAEWVILRPLSGDPRERYLLAPILHYLHLTDFRGSEHLLRQ
jgi:hypothetical protein